jgi:hypothetical protein
MEENRKELELKLWSLKLYILREGDGGFGLVGWVGLPVLIHLGVGAGGIICI